MDHAWLEIAASTMWIAAGVFEMTVRRQERKQRAEEMRAAREERRQMREWFAAVAQKWGPSS